MKVKIIQKVQFNLNFLNQILIFLLNQMTSQINATSKLPEWRIAMIDLFVGGALIVGLPKSVGQIYGYLYSAIEPSSMEQIISDLRISKGSTSQGLKFLRQIGAVKVKFLVGDRKDHFVAEVKSKKLIRGFIREKLTQALEDGSTRVAFIRDLMSEDGKIENSAHLAQVTKLETWHRKLKLALPVIQKLLGE